MISSKILKTLIVVLAKPLAHIFNLSFLCGTFPKKLKCAIIRAVYKLGDKNNMNNYRPISLLSNVSKLLENMH